MLAVAGATAIVVTVFAVTVSAAMPLTPLSVAVKVVEPAAAAVARPAALMLATAAFDELHVAVDVTFCVVPLL